MTLEEIDQRLPAFKERLRELRSATKASRSLQLEIQMIEHDIKTLEAMREQQLEKR